jgi:hypothetical protein
VTNAPTHRTDRYQSCIHEAGHAVIAHSLGVFVRDMWVDFGPGSGVCNTDPTDHRTSVHIRLAGPIAELHYWDQVGGGPADRHPMHSAHDDNKEAWEEAQAAHPGDPAAAKRLLREAQTTVGVMVPERWELIARIATAASMTTNGILKHRPLMELMDADGHTAMGHLSD